jgi:acetyl-CoA synthetase
MPEHGREVALQAWARLGRELDWDEPFSVVHRGDGVQGEWFVGGRLNAAANCLDRHLSKRRDQAALHWEGEPGDSRSLTYGELHDEVAALAEALQMLGVSVGDRVALYMGWIPETVVAMLACARLGAVQVVVPVSIPADSVADRLADFAPKVLLTQDGAWRHGVMLPLKARADEALAAVASVDHTVVVRRTGVDVAWYEGDRWFHELVASRRRVEANQRAPLQYVPVPADHPLLIAHISDQRGHPKAVVHRTGGLTAYAAAVHRFALTASHDDVLWMAVEIGWAAGQTHGVYGPLLCGATAVMFEGMLDTPNHERAWEVVERYGVNTMMTTPSVWRRLREWTDPRRNLGGPSLAHVVSAGEPMDIQTRTWLEKEVAPGRVSFADAWGQIELGGAVTFSATRGGELPDPGLAIVDDEGHEVPAGVTGELVVRYPWPGLMLEARGVEDMWYWRRPGVYSTNDLARRDDTGKITVLGRLDPVISVSGQLVSATEVRDVLIEHPLISAAEVVERAEPEARASVVACVVCEPGVACDERFATELRNLVHDMLGGLAEPRVIAFCESLPADVPRQLLRRVLWRSCAGSTGDHLMLTGAQISAALAAVQQEMA